MGLLTEVFEYPFSRLDPVTGDHIDPPSQAVYETLLTKGPDGAPRPGLATSWTVSPDGLLWSMRLRAGARFHSGAPCDAVAVAEALSHCRWGDGFTRQVWYWDPVDTVTTAGSDCIVIRLHYPCARLPVLLWGHHSAIANPAARRADPVAHGVTVFDGTGPYAVTSYGPQEVLAQQLAAGNRVSSIRWLAQADMRERQESLQDPEIDIIRAVNPESLDPDDPEWRQVSYHENSQIYLALNFEDPRGFGRAEFRRALEALIDRTELVAVALGGYGDARRSPVPLADEFATAFDDLGASRPSREEARFTLQQLAFPRENLGLRQIEDRLEIECVVQDTQVVRRVAEVLRQQLLQVGVVLKCQYVPVFEDFYRAVAGGPPAFISKWLWGDAMEAIMGFSRSDCDADSGGNWQHARTPMLDRAYDRFLQATSPAELAERSADVQSVFMTELPYLPLCSPLETYAIRRRIHGYQPFPRILYPSYSHVQKESEHDAR